MMCSCSCSNLKTSNQQFSFICVSAFLVPLYGFDVQNAVGHGSTQSVPLQGATANPCLQSNLAKSWKIYSSLTFCRTVCYTKVSAELVLAIVNMYKWAVPQRVYEKLDKKL